MTKKLNLKTRSSFHCYLLSDKVQDKIEAIQKATKLSKWLVVEKLLEKSLDIKSEDQTTLEDYLKGKK